ncbi:MAG: Ppx/GppA phosphatase family protein [Pseudobdellovibrio sp.]
MKVAALDLGSNTFLCLVAEVTTKGIEKVYQDEVEVVRLGQGLSQNKNFHPEALQRADQCLEKFSKIINLHKPEKILAMATSAARDAENKEELFKLGKKYNIPIEIIPGDKEADITYQGAVSGLKAQNQNYLILDIGGGSTEFIFGRDQKRLNGKSFDIGCVRLTEKFISAQPTPEIEVKNAVDFIKAYVEQARRLQPPDFKLDCILAVAGTPTTLAAAEIGRFETEKIDGFQFTEENLEKWLRKIQKATFEEKIEMGIPAGRADVILIGIIILLETLRAFNKKSLTVSTRGVRYGVAFEIFNRYRA